MIVQTTTFSPTPSAASDARTGSSPEAGKPQVAVSGQVAAQSVEPSRAEIDAAVERANRASSLEARNLKFRVDEQTDRVIVTVVDKETGETVREIPPEVMLAIAKSMDRYQKGLLLSQEA